jgi:hypothetical protein
MGIETNTNEPNKGVTPAFQFNWSQMESKLGAVLIWKLGQYQPSRDVLCCSFIVFEAGPLPNLHRLPWAGRNPGSGSGMPVTQIPITSAVAYFLPIDSGSLTGPPISVRRLPHATDGVPCCVMSA